MSNLDLIRQLYALFAARDYDGFIAICSPDLRWIQNPGFPGGGTWHGPQAVVDNVFKRFSNEWDGWRFVIEEYLDAGPTIIVIGHYEGTHRTTGKAFHAAAAHVYDVKDCKVVRFRQFTDTHVIHAARNP